MKGKYKTGDRIKLKCQCYSHWATLILKLITVHFSHTRGTICVISNLNMFVYLFQWKTVIVMFCSSFTDVFLSSVKPC